MYLLDTDILSNVVKPTPSLALLARLAATPAERLFTSSITLGELVYGAHRLGARGVALLSRIQNTVLGARPVLPFDASAALRYGALRAELERDGIPLGEADLRIASIVLARNLTVVTGNVGHFQRVTGLAVENWLA